MTEGGGYPGMQCECRTILHYIPAVIILTNLLPETTWMTQQLLQWQKKKSGPKNPSENVCAHSRLINQRVFVIPELGLFLYRYQCTVTALTEEYGEHTLLLWNIWTIKKCLFSGSNSFCLHYTPTLKIKTIENKTKNMDIFQNKIFHMVLFPCGPVLHYPGPDNTIQDQYYTIQDQNNTVQDQYSTI